MKVFAIKDKTAEIFNNPFYQNTTAEALRALRSALSEKSSMVCQFPDDYELFELGTWNNSEGNIIMYPAPVSLGTAKQFASEPKLKAAN